MRKTTTRLMALAAVLFTGQLFAQLTPEVLYYKFDGSGTTVPNLASAPPVGTTNATIMGSITQGGNGICRGTLIGSGLGAGTDYLNTGWTTNLGTGSWTISFRTSGISTNATLYYIFGDNTANSFRCFTNGVAGSTNWILRGGGLTDTYINGGALSTPTMCTYVYDQALNQVRGYLNGVLVTTVAQTAPNITGTGPFKVMGYATNVGAPAGGMMDEFRVYSRALTAAEITQLYNPFSSNNFVTPATASICPGNNQVLNVGGWPTSAVSWSTTATTDAITITQPGTYTATVSGACGSGTASSVISSLVTTNTITANSCTSYLSPAGNTYTVSGTYTDTLTNSANCDSIITINLTVNPPTTSTMSVSTCSASYTAPSGAVFSSSGTYTDTIANSTGCDSVITINLTMLQPSTSTITTTSCDMYTSPGGDMYMASGTYMDTIPNMAGCDSVITINLTIINATTSSITVSACDTYTAPSGAIYTSSGTYTDVIPNMAGCDSTITIDLTVNMATTGTITTTACDTYTAPSGAIYTSSGTYTDVIPNMAGCDSTITINLTVNAGTASSMNATACGSYTAPSGAVYTSSGTYTDVIPNMAGCDSTITINLTVNTVNVSATQAGATLTASASGASYQWINCSNNSPIAGATSQSYTATANGNYAVIVTQNNCSDTSACLSVTGIGISENDFSKSISLYPNPNQGEFVIDLGMNYTDVTITISDVTGRTVSLFASANTNRIPVSLNEAAGVYFIRIVAGDQQALVRVVKQ